MTRGLFLQRKCGCGDACGDCGKKEDEKLQRKGGGRSVVTAIPDSVHNVLRSTGQPLDVATRARMEPRFGFDFSRVRVHADPAADASVRDVGATAYAVGYNVAFASGRYRPGTHDGDMLLAHELAHVVQQKRADGSLTTKNEVGSASSALEADADRSAERATVLWGHAAHGGRDATGAARPRLHVGTRLSMRGDDPDLPSPGEHGSGSEATPNSATPPPVPEVTPSFLLQGKEKKRWRFSYEKGEADAFRRYVARLGIRTDELPCPSRKQCTFDYYPLTKEEAEVEKKTREKALPKYEITVKKDSTAKSYYLKVLKKCPEGMDPKSGYKIWDDCFTKSDAAALVRKMRGAKTEAESVQVNENRWGVYYKPMTQQEAQTAGDAAAAARPGADEGMYKVSTEEKKTLKTFAYSVKTECPPGYKDLGTFKITAYYMAHEEDFQDELVEENSFKGKFRRGFLRAVKMESIGRALDGRLIHFDTRGGFRVVNKVEVALAGAEALVGRTVAVDTKIIKLGSELLIEDIGERVAEDTGGNIQGQEIDVYYGETKGRKEANRSTLKGKKKVCRKTKP